MSPGVSARGRFRKGDRVRMTDECSALMRPNTVRTGVVVGFGREPHRLRILRDGLRSVETWDYSYWRWSQEGGDRS